MLTDICFDFPPMNRDLIQLLREQWVTTVDAQAKISCYSLSQRCGEIGPDPALRLMGLEMHKKWHKLKSGKRVMAYRLLPKG